MHVGRPKPLKTDATVHRCVSNLQNLGMRGIEKETAKVVDAVREMIWNEPTMRAAYERLRGRGFSADDAVIELTLRHVEALWELSQAKSLERATRTA